MPHWCILLSLYHSILFIILFYISKFKSQVIQETLPKCPQKGGGVDYLNASVLWRVVLFYHSFMIFILESAERRRWFYLCYVCWPPALPSPGLQISIFSAYWGSSLDFHVPVSLCQHLCLVIISLYDFYCIGYFVVFYVSLEFFFIHMDTSPFTAH